MSRTLLPCALVALTLLAGCDSAESLRVAETRAQLAGTWLRELDDETTKVRRVLALGTDGKFSDRLVVTTAGQPAERQEAAGEWSYDGTHLKRRYLQENGRQFSGGKMRYATFPLVSVGRSDLVLNDNLQGREVSFRRVPDGTQP
jgi:hypothetical protein